MLEVLQSCGITAPFPARETAELPITFVATIVAYMLAPDAIVNGAVCKIEI